MSAWLALLVHELRLAMRRGSDWGNPLVFFLMVIALFPLGVGPAPKQLALMAGGVIWIAALLAVLLSMDSLFRQDFEDGTLEQLLLARQPLQLVVLGKVTAHWLQTGLVLAVLSPVAGLMLQLPGAAVGTLFLTLLLGTPTLSLLASVGAALTVSLRRAGVLLPLLTLPLHIPVLIFACGAVQAASQGLPVLGFLAILASLLVLALTLVPFAVAAALRLAHGS